jgi:hypothetical protein
MSTVQLADINSTIISGAFNDEQLNSIASAIKFARNQLVRQNTGSLVKGSKVKFTSSRNGIGTVTGTVEKVNRKYVIVRETTNGLVGSSWRVPANMLQPA